MKKEIIVNGFTFNVLPTIADDKCYRLEYDNVVVIDDSACEDFYGDINEVADRFKVYVEEECKKPYPWFTLIDTILVKDSEPITIEDDRTAKRYGEIFNNGTTTEVLDQTDFERAKKALDLEDWDVAHIYSFAYEYGKRGYFCLSNKRD